MVESSPLSLIFMIFMSFQYLAYGKNNLEENYSTLNDELFMNYDMKVRPKYGGSPVCVGVSFHLLGISKLDDNTQRMTFTTKIQQRWRDSRLVFSPSRLNSTIMRVLYEHTWIPDTFFVNEISVIEHDAYNVNDKTFLDHEGIVTRSQKITVQTTCSMNFYTFPMDLQICPVIIESYGYEASDINFYWDFKNMITSMDYNREDTEKYAFLGIDFKATSATMMTTGNYSRLTANFKFARKTGYYVYCFYVPATMITLFAYASMWLNAKTQKCRLTFGVTAFMLMSFVYINNVRVAPDAAVLTLLDIYSAISFIVIFYILLYHVVWTNGFQGKFLLLKDTGNSSLIQKYIRVGYGVVILILNILYWIIVTSV